MFHLSGSDQKNHDLKEEPHLTKKPLVSSMITHSSDSRELSQEFKTESLNYSIKKEQQLKDHALKAEELKNLSLEIKALGKLAIATSQSSSIESLRSYLESKKARTLKEIKKISTELFYKKDQLDQLQASMQREFGQIESLIINFSPIQERKINRIEEEKKRITFSHLMNNEEKIQSLIDEYADRHQNLEQQLQQNEKKSYSGMEIITKLSKEKEQQQLEEKTLLNKQKEIKSRLSIIKQNLDKKITTQDNNNQDLQKLAIDISQLKSLIEFNNNVWVEKKAINLKVVSGGWPNKSEIRFADIQREFKYDSTTNKSRGINLFIFSTVDTIRLIYSNSFDTHADSKQANQLFEKLNEYNKEKKQYLVVLFVHDEASENLFNEDIIKKKSILGDIGCSLSTEKLGNRQPYIFIGQINPKKVYFDMLGCRPHPFWQAFLDNKNLILAEDIVIPIIAEEKKALLFDKINKLQENEKFKNKLNNEVEILCKEIDKNKIEFIEIEAKLTKAAVNIQNQEKQIKQQEAQQALFYAESASIKNSIQATKKDLEKFQERLKLIQHRKKSDSDNPEFNALFDLLELTVKKNINSQQEICNIKEKEIKIFQDHKLASQESVLASSEISYQQIVQKNLTELKKAHQKSIDDLAQQAKQTKAIVDSFKEKKTTSHEELQRLKDELQTQQTHSIKLDQQLTVIKEEAILRSQHLELISEIQQYELQLKQAEGGLYAFERQQISFLNRLDTLHSQLSQQTDILSSNPLFYQLENLIDTELGRLETYQQSLSLASEQCQLDQCYHKNLHVTALARGHLLTYFDCYENGVKLTAAESLIALLLSYTLSIDNIYSPYGIKNVRSDIGGFNDFASQVRAIYKLYLDQSKQLKKSADFYSIILELVATDYPHCKFSLMTETGIKTSPLTIAQTSLATQSIELVLTKNAEGQFVAACSFKKYCFSPENKEQENLKINFLFNSLNEFNNHYLKAIISDIIQCKFKPQELSCVTNQDLETWYKEFVSALVKLESWQDFRSFLLKQPVNSLNSTPCYQAFIFHLNAIQQMDRDFSTTLSHESAEWIEYKSQRQDALDTVKKQFNNTVYDIISQELQKRKRKQDSVAKMRQINLSIESASQIISQIQLQVGLIAQKIQTYQAKLKKIALVENSNQDKLTAEEKQINKEIISLKKTLEQSETQLQKKEAELEKSIHKKSQLQRQETQLDVKGIELEKSAKQLSDKAFTTAKSKLSLDCEIIDFDMEAKIALQKKEFAAQKHQAVEKRLTYSLAWVALLNYLPRFCCLVEIFQHHKKINNQVNLALSLGCDLYLMSEFNTQECEKIKGNAVILTDKNTAYFIIEDKIVMKDEKVQTVEKINRQDIALSYSTKPKKYMVSHNKKEEIIEQATSKGGHTLSLKAAMTGLLTIDSITSDSLKSFTAKLIEFMHEESKRGEYRYQFLSQYKPELLSDILSNLIKNPVEYTFDAESKTNNYLDKFKQITQASLGQLQTEFYQTSVALTQQPSLLLDKYQVRAVNASLSDIYAQLQKDILDKINANLDAGNPFIWIRSETKNNPLLQMKANCFSTEQTIVQSVNPQLHALINDRIQRVYPPNQWELIKQAKGSYATEIFNSLQVSEIDAFACFIHEVEIISTGALFYDASLYFGGIDLTIRSKQLHFGAGSQFKDPVKIITSGRPAFEFPVKNQKAPDGEKGALQRDGSAGTDGLDGEQGHSGGNLMIKVTAKITGWNYLTHVECSGSKGAIGQLGGDGGKGGDGKPGTDGSPASVEKDAITAYSAAGELALKPGMGGDAGRSGRDGLPGLAGQIVIDDETYLIQSNSDTESIKKEVFIYGKDKESKFKKTSSLPRLQSVEELKEVKFIINNGNAVDPIKDKQKCDRVLGGQAGAAFADGLDCVHFSIPRQYSYWYSGSDGWCSTQQVRKGIFYEDMRQSIKVDSIRYLKRLDDWTYHFNWFNAYYTPNISSCTDSSKIILDEQKRTINIKTPVYGIWHHGPCGLQYPAYFFELPEVKEAELREQTQRSNQQKATESNKKHAKDGRAIGLREDKRAAQSLRTPLTKSEFSQQAFSHHEQSFNMIMKNEQYDQVTANLQEEAAALQAEIAQSAAAAKNATEKKQAKQEASQQLQEELTQLNQQQMILNEQIRTQQREQQVIRQAIDSHQHEIHQLSDDIDALKLDMLITNMQDSQEQHYKTKVDQHHQSNQKRIIQTKQAVNDLIKKEKQKLDDLETKLTAAKTKQQHLNKQCSHLDNKQADSEETSLQKIEVTKQQQVEQEQEEIRRQTSQNTQTILNQRVLRLFPLSLQDEWALHSKFSKEIISILPKAKNNLKINKLYYLEGELRKLYFYLNQSRNSATHSIIVKKIIDNLKCSLLYSLISQSGKKLISLTWLEAIIHKKSLSSKDIDELNQLVTYLLKIIYKKHFIFHREIKTKIKNLKQVELIQQYYEKIALLEQIELKKNKPINIDKYLAIDRGQTAYSAVENLIRIYNSRKKKRTVIVAQIRYLLNKYVFDLMGFQHIPELKKELKKNRIEIKSKKNLGESWFLIVLKFDKITQKNSNNILIWNQIKIILLIIQDHYKIFLQENNAARKKFDEFYRFLQVNIKQDYITLTHQLKEYEDKLNIDLLEINMERKQNSDNFEKSKDSHPSVFIEIKKLIKLPEITDATDQVQKKLELLIVKELNYFNEYPKNKASELAEEFKTYIVDESENFSIITKKNNLLSIFCMLKELGELENFSHFIPKLISSRAYFGNNMLNHANIQEWTLILKSILLVNKFVLSISKINKPPSFPDSLKNKILNLLIQAGRSDNQNEDYIQWGKIIDSGQEDQLSFLYKKFENKKSDGIYTYASTKKILENLKKIFSIEDKNQYKNSKSKAESALVSGKLIKINEDSKSEHKLSTAITENKAKSDSAQSGLSTYLVDKIKIYQEFYLNFDGEFDVILAPLLESLHQTMDVFHHISNKESKHSVSLRLLSISNALLEQEQLGLVPSAYQKLRGLFSDICQQCKSWLKKLNSNNPPNKLLLLNQVEGLYKNLLLVKQPTLTQYLKCKDNKVLFNRACEYLSTDSDQYLQNVLSFSQKQNLLNIIFSQLYADKKINQLIIIQLLSSCYFTKLQIDQLTEQEFKVALKDATIRKKQFADWFNKNKKNLGHTLEDCSLFSVLASECYKLIDYNLRELLQLKLKSKIALLKEKIENIIELEKKQQCHILLNSLISPDSLLSLRQRILFSEQLIDLISKEVIILSEFTNKFAWKNFSYFRDKFGIILDKKERKDVGSDQISIDWLLGLLAGWPKDPMDPKKEPAWSKEVLLYQFNNYVNNLNISELEKKPTSVKDSDKLLEDLTKLVVKDKEISLCIAESIDLIIKNRLKKHYLSAETEAKEIESKIAAEKTKLLNQYQKITQSLVSPQLRNQRQLFLELVVEKIDFLLISSNPNQRASTFQQLGEFKKNEEELTLRDFEQKLLDFLNIENYKNFYNQVNWLSLDIKLKNNSTYTIENIKLIIKSLNEINSEKINTQLESKKINLEGLASFFQQIISLFNLFIFSESDSEKTVELSELLKTWHSNLQAIRQNFNNQLLKLKKDDINQIQVSNIVKLSGQLIGIIADKIKLLDYTKFSSSIVKATARQIKTQKKLIQTRILDQRQQFKTIVDAIDYHRSLFDIKAKDQAEVVRVNHALYQHAMKLKNSEQIPALLKNSQEELLTISLIKPEKAIKLLKDKFKDFSPKTDFDSKDCKDKSKTIQSPGLFKFQPKRKEDYSQIDQLLKSPFKLAAILKNYTHLLDMNTISGFIDYILQKRENPYVEIRETNLLFIYCDLGLSNALFDKIFIDDQDRNQTIFLFDEARDKILSIFERLSTKFIADFENLLSLINKFFSLLKQGTQCLSFFVEEIDNYVLILINKDKSKKIELAHELSDKYLKEDHKLFLEVIQESKDTFKDHAYIGNLTRRYLSLFGKLEPFHIPLLSHIHDKTLAQLPLEEKEIKLSKVTSFKALLAKLNCTQDTDLEKSLFFNDLFTDNEVLTEKGELILFLLQEKSAEKSEKKIESSPSTLIIDTLEANSVDDWHEALLDLALEKIAKISKKSTHFPLNIDCIPKAKHDLIIRCYQNLVFSMQLDDYQPDLDKLNNLLNSSLSSVENQKKSGIISQIEEIKNYFDTLIQFKLTLITAQTLSLKNNSSRFLFLIVKEFYNKNLFQKKESITLANEYLNFLNDISDIATLEKILSSIRKVQQIYTLCLNDLLFDRLIEAVLLLKQKNFNNTAFDESIDKIDQLKLSVKEKISIHTEENINKLLATLGSKVIQYNHNQIEFPIAEFNDYLNKIKENIPCSDSLVYQLENIPLHGWSELFAKESLASKINFLNISEENRDKIIELLYQLNKKNENMTTLLVDAIKARVDKEKVDLLVDLFFTLKFLNSGIMDYEKNQFEKLKNTPIKDWRNDLKVIVQYSGLGKLVEKMSQEEKISSTGVNYSIRNHLSTEENSTSLLFGKIYNFYGKKFNDIEEEKFALFDKQTKSNILLECKEPIKDWGKDQIIQWAIAFKQKSYTRDYCFSWKNDILPEMMAVIARAVKLEFGYNPRSTQLFSLALFLDSSNTNKGRLGNISTGQGKTLITAMLAVCQALIGEKVDVVTSSPILAQDGLKESENFFKLFQLSANTNCDEKASKPGDEGNAIRQKRYATSDIIYGDASSFQRDILLTQFFNKEVRLNASQVGGIPGVQKNVAHSLILDEVDSMLVDNSSKTLYISHNIIDLRHIQDIFIHIWNNSNAKDTYWDDETSRQKVYDSIQLMIEKGNILIPGHPSKLKSFIDCNLKKWIENAYKAKVLQENNHYIVGDEASGKPGEIIPIAKDIGVEQLNTNWSNGLTQFLQLKHKLKLTDESLKGIFISNISFFKRYQNINGMTGTLGGKKETKLLEKVYDLSFFEMPEFCSSRYLQNEGAVCGTTTEFYQKIIDEIKHQDLPLNFDAKVRKEEINLSVEKLKEQQLEFKQVIQKLKESIIELEKSKKDREDKYDASKEKEKNLVDALRSTQEEADRLILLQNDLKLQEERLKKFDQQLKCLNRELECPTSQSNAKRATLIICENIDDAKKIRAALLKDFESRGISNRSIRLYDRAYNPLESNEVTAGDIIIATNIAGRGTDLLTDHLLEANGGLHVILSYMPANLRIERQAFGRTARKGNKGTGKFIVYDPRKQDEDITIDDLRAERDELEWERLAMIEKEQLKIIELEAQLFDKFNEVNQLLEAQLIEKGTEKSVKEIQLDNLRNQWAFWLNEMDPLINQAYDREKEQLVYEKFNQFKLDIFTDITKKFGLISEPIELSKLGYQYFHQGEYAEAISCFNDVIKNFPNFAAQAHYYKGLAIIGQGTGGYQDRIEAKEQFKHAKALLEQSRSALGARKQIVDLIAQGFEHQSGKGARPNYFSLSQEEEGRLISQHIRAIEDAIGSPLAKESLQSGLLYGKKLAFLFKELVQNPAMVKNYRISKKVMIKDDLKGNKSVYYVKNNQEKKIELPEPFQYCHPDILEVLQKKVGADKDHSQRTLTSQAFTSCVFGLETFRSITAGFILEKELIERKNIKTFTGTLSDPLFKGKGKQVIDFITGESIILDEKTKKFYCWEQKSPAKDYKHEKDNPILKSQFTDFLNDLGIDSQQHQKIVNFLSDKRVVSVPTNIVDLLNQKDSWDALPELKNPNRCEFLKKIFQTQQSVVLSSYEKIIIKPGQVIDYDKLIEIFTIKSIISDPIQKDEIKLIDKFLSIFEFSITKKEGLLQTKKYFTLNEEKSEFSKINNNFILQAEKKDDIDKLDLSGSDYLSSKSAEIKERLLQLTKENDYKKRDFTFDEFKAIYSEKSSASAEKNEQDLIFNFQVLKQMLNDKNLLECVLWEKYIPEKLKSNPKTQKFKFEIESVLEYMVENNGQIDLDHPLLKSEKILSKEIWLYFLDAGLIKGRSLFQKIVDKPDEEKIKQHIESEVKKVFGLEKKQDGVEDYLNPFAGDKNEEVNKYINDILQTIKQTAGTLRIYKKVELGDKDIQEMFADGKIPPAITDYIQMFFTQVIHLVEKKEFEWNWDAFWCCMIGLAQVIAGVVLAACTFGGAAALSQMLIGEGIGDMVFAIQASIQGNFSWKAYCQHKVVSLALTVVSMGVGAFLSKGTKAGTQALTAAQQAAKEAAKNATKAVLAKQMMKQIVLHTVEVGMQVGISKLADLSSGVIMDHIIDEQLDAELKIQINNIGHVKERVERALQRLSRVSAYANGIIQQCIEETLAEFRQGDTLGTVLGHAKQITNTIANAAPKNGAGWGATLGSGMRVIDKITKAANVIAAIASISQLPAGFYTKLLEKLNEKAAESDADSAVSPLSAEQAQQKIKSIDSLIINEIKSITRQKLINEAMSWGLNKIYQKSIGKRIQGEINKSSEFLGFYKEHKQQEQRQEPINQFITDPSQFSNKQRKKPTKECQAFSLDQISLDPAMYDRIKDLPVDNWNGMTVNQLKENFKKSKFKIKIIQHQGKMIALPIKSKSKQKQRLLAEKFKNYPVAQDPAAAMNHAHLKMLADRERRTIRLYDADGRLTHIVHPHGLRRIISSLPFRSAAKIIYIPDAGGGIGHLTAKNGSGFNKQPDNTYLCLLYAYYDSLGRQRTEAQIVAKSQRLFDYTQRHQETYQRSYDNWSNKGRLPILGGISQKGTYGDRDQHREDLMRTYGRAAIHGQSRDSNGRITERETHQGEHVIGYNVVDQRIGGRGSDQIARSLENSLPAYYEGYTSHRAHIGTGMRARRDQTGMNSRQYRRAQRTALIMGNPGDAIQLNQLGYAFIYGFRRQARHTRQGQVATNSYQQMLLHSPSHIPYLDNGTVMYTLFPAKQRAEAYLAREVVLTRAYPSSEREQEVLALFDEYQHLR